MYLYFSRPLLVVFSGWIAFSGAVYAQSPPSLREAIESAWRLTPQAHALQNQGLELEARGRAASSFTSGPPSISLSQRSDRFNSNTGMRESEAEIAVPLWTPGVRKATADQVAADRDVLERQSVTAKLRIAAEVRELAAQAALAQIERQISLRKADETRVLAADIERRVKAGETARVDFLQARATAQQAAATRTQAESALNRTKAQWRALTGLEQISPLDEAIGVTQEHPAIAAADGQLRAAQAKLALTEADRRDPMEVGLGVARERSAFGAAGQNSMKLSLRIPLGSDNRNAPKLAAARAEVDAAQAEALTTARTVESEQSASKNELETARKNETLAAERAQLSAEVQALIAKSYRLGESDLPSRLRADNEKFEAELAHARAGVETRRAISKYNQAFGILP